MPRECGPFHFALYLSANLFLEYLKKRFATCKRLEPGQSILPWGFEQLELWVGCLSYVDRDAVKLLEMVKKGDLEWLVVKRKDRKYSQQTLWYKVLNLS
jgi:hypothetical protein